MNFETVYLFVIPILLAMLKDEIRHTILSLKAYFYRQFDDGDPNTLELLQLMNPASGEFGNVMVDRYVPHIPVLGPFLRRWFPCIGNVRERGVFYYALQFQDDGRILMVARKTSLLNWANMVNTSSAAVKPDDRERIEKAFEKGLVYGEKHKYKVSN